MKYILVTIALVFHTLHTTQAQTLSVFNIDVQQFPTVRAKMFAFQKDGSQAIPKADEITITENGIKRTVGTFQCTSSAGTVALSAVLTIDLSTSMNSRITGTETNLAIAQAFASTFVNQLPMGASECALTSFNDTNYLNTPFTTSKSLILNELPSLKPFGKLSYDAAFFDAPAGAFRVAAHGKNKRMIVLISDGTPSMLPVVNDIVSTAQKLNCSVNCVMIGVNAPQWLRDISTRTGGMMYNNVSSITQAENAARELLLIAQGGKPCEMTWLSELPCMILPTEVRIEWGTTKVDVRYTAPYNASVELFCTPQFIAYGKRVKGNSYDTTLRLTARNQSIRVLGIVAKTPTTSFSVIGNFPLDIPANETRTVRVRYTAIDTLKTYCAFDILTDKCPSSFSVNAGYAVGSVRALQVTQPRGGETHVAGNPLEIRWDGISPSDTISLLYSLNNGSTWGIITNKAAGLRYVWNKVPRVNNGSLLIRTLQRNDGTGDGLSPDAEWSRTFGGNGFDNFNAVRITQDGGYIFAGFTHSTNLDTAVSLKGVRDVWLVKTDRNGAIEWQRTLGGSRSDGARDIRQTRDGGYIIAGYTESSDSDVTTRKGLQDMWIVKTDNKGAIQWQRSYGGLYDDDASSVQELPNGGYVFAGFTRSSNGDVRINKGKTDAWIIRTNADGRLLWERTIGGSKHDYARSVAVTRDGLIVVTGYSESDDGDVPLNNGDSDAWLVTLNSDGDAVVSQQNIGGTFYDGFTNHLLSTSNKVSAVGLTLSYNGDIPVNKGGSDGLLVRMNLDGTDKRITTYGGSGSDAFNAVVQLANGDYAMAGGTLSYDGDVPSNRGTSDYWIIRTDSNGVLLWSKAMGGTKIDDASSVIETADKGLLIAGSSYSNDGDVKVNRGDGDAWVIKLGTNESGILNDDTLQTPVTIVVPHLSSLTTINLGRCTVGTSRDSVIEQSIRNSTPYPVRIDSLRIVGTDLTQFRVVGVRTNSILEAGESFSYELRFSPAFEGARTATLEIFTQTDTIRQTLLGEGVQPTLRILNTLCDFGRVALGYPQDTTVVAFQNVGTQPLRITSLRIGGRNSSTFSIIAGNAPLVLQPQQKHSVTVRCTALDSGEVSARLFVDSDALDTPQSMVLVAEIYKRIIVPVPDTVSTTIAVSDVEAAIGGRIRIYLYTATKHNTQLANAPKVFTARLRINPTVVLTDTTPYPCVTLDTNTCEMTIRGERQQSDTLLYIDATATLGTTDNAVIEIVSFQWQNSDSMIVTDVRLRNGSVRIIDVCDAGGVRLFIPQGARQSLSARPNPAFSAVTIEYGLAEQSAATLDIINSMGQVVASPLIQRQHRAGLYQIRFDVSGLASGMYILRLSTPNMMLTSRMDIVR